MTYFAAYKLKKLFKCGLIFCCCMCFFYTLTMYTDIQFFKFAVLFMLILCSLVILIISFVFVYVLLSCMVGIGWKKGRLSSRRLLRCSFAEGLSRQQVIGKRVVYWFCPFLGTYILEVIVND